jgi:glycosyltransferase involved in cell wall biosynthesis
MEALQFGTPVVATRIGAEGLGLQDGVEIDVADDADEFAERLVAMLTDDDAWVKRREAIEKRIAGWESERVSWRDVVMRTESAVS